MRAKRVAIRYSLSVKAFSTAFTRGMPHGLLAAVNLPQSLDEFPESVLRRLHPSEREQAIEMRGFRQIQWVGGRLAAKVAVNALGVDMGGLLQGPRGEPKAPKSLTISISHKKNLAVALVAKKRHGIVGMDFETVGEDRRHIANKILRPEEIAAVEALPDHRQWTAMLLRFSLKEAIYKAIAPRLQRYIGFDEAHVEIGKDGETNIELKLENGPTPAHIEGRYEWLHEGLISTVRVRWD